MNIRKLNEELQKLTEDIDFENEQAERGSALRVYQKAYMALEELQDKLEEGISPSGSLDMETEEFYNKLQDMINEIHSRSLAFEG